MKKIIATLILIFISSSSFNLAGQKTRRSPQDLKKSAASQVNKNVESEIKSAEAFSDGNGALLKWRTGAETNLVGFNIYRSNGRENVRVNENLILSSRIRNGQSFAGGGDYVYFDEKGGFQGSYFIEGIFSEGKRNLSQPIFPRYTNDLVNVSAMSSAAFRQSKASAQPVLQSSKNGRIDDSKTKTEIDQLVADLDRQKWVAAQPGVKIAVSKEGFYRVSRAELEAAGFDVNSSSSLWQLYLNGEEQSIIAEDKGQYIEFFNANFEDTAESGYQFYYLVVGPNQGKRINSRFARRIGGSVEATNYFQVQTKKERIYYIANIRNGDNQNFFGSFISSSPVTINFDLK